MKLDSEKHVEILLATFNGQQFVAPQIESILNQSYQNWKLIVHDDNSTDDTATVIRHFANLHPQKIRFIDDTTFFRSPAKNFNYLLRHCSANYIMFCDQDDIWKKDKIEKTMFVMQKTEFAYGATTPILVHTDLEIVDENLHTTSHSLWAYQKLNQRLTSDILALAIQNTVTGNTMMFNRALFVASVPIPKQALMHDWWIALVACKHGLIVPCHESLIKYRQHGDNEVGAIRPNLKHYLKRFSRLPIVISTTRKAYIQAKRANISVTPLIFLRKKICLVFKRIQ